MFVLVVMLATLLTSAVTFAQSDLAVTTLDAQTVNALDSPEAVREMVSRLSDTEVRSLLLQRLDVVVGRRTQEQPTGGLLAFVGVAASGVASSVGEAIKSVPLLWQGQTTSLANFAKGRGFTGVLYFIGCLLAAALAGLAAEWLIERFASDWREHIAQTTEPQSLAEAIRVLGLRLLLDIGGLIAFIIVTYWVLGALIAPRDAPVARVIMVGLVVLPRSMAAFLRFLLAPKRADLRLVHTDDDSAQFLYRHMIALAVLMGCTYVIPLFNELNGVPLGEMRLGFWLNTAVHIYLVVIAWRARAGLMSMMLGADTDVTPLESRIARAYPWFAIGVSVGVWLLVEILVAFNRLDLLISGQHYWTMGLLLMAPAMDTLIRGLVKHLTPPMSGEGLLAEQAYLSTKRSYIRIGRVIMFGIVVLILAKLWNIEFHDIASVGVGARAAARLFEVLMIVAVGYLVWEATTAWMNRMLAAEHTAQGAGVHHEEPGGGEGGGAGSSRLATVLPILRMTVQVAIIVMTALVALGNIGIDVTPLLAGAGIVGLAIGFGAQKLVTDIVSGIFFLIDDAFRAGEYIDAGGTLGTVEKISIRSVQLRHHRGPINTVPYGEIPKVTNFSRDWAIMKLRFTVPFDTDVNKVKKIFKKIGQEMLEIPEYKDDFLQPFKSQGVLEVDDVGIVVRGKFMAKPGTQFTLRKEIYQRVQKAFEENGIQFARKEVRVKVDGADGEGLSDSDRQAIGAAATTAAEETPPITKPD